MGSLLDSDYSDFDTFSPPKVGHTKNYVSTSLVLTVLLTVITPFLATVGGLPVLPLVALTGLVYAAFVVVTDTLFEGVSSALFVLLVFNADIPLVNAPGPAQFDVFLMDLPLVLALALLLWWEYTESRTRFRTETAIAVGSLGFFVLWSFISAVVANGPSQSAAVMFGATQLRYGLILVASVLIVRRTNVWCGIYPLIIAVSGNVLVALTQAVNDGPLGLSYLGEVGPGYISRVVLGPLVTRSGMYVGGFTGQSRLFTGVLLLVVPLVVFLSVRRSRWKTILTGCFVLSAAFIVRMSESDAGWASLLLTLVLSIVVLSYYAYRESDRRYYPGISYCVLSIAISIGMYTSRFIGPSTDGADPEPSGGTGGSTGSQAPSTQESATNFIASVPVVQASTFPIRVQQWAASVELVSMYPLFGVGGHNFYLLSESLGLPRAFAVHNTFLAHLAATGFPGAIAYILGIGTVLFVVLRHAVFAPGEAGTFWGLLAAGMIGFHALSFWVTIHNSVVAFSTFWAVCGMALAADRNVLRQSRIGNGSQ